MWMTGKRGPSSKSDYKWTAQMCPESWIVFTRSERNKYNFSNSTLHSSSFGNCMHALTTLQIGTRKYPRCTCLPHERRGTNQAYDNRFLQLTNNISSGFKVHWFAYHVIGKLGLCTEWKQWKWVIDLYINRILMASRPLQALVPRAGEMP